MYKFTKDQLSSLLSSTINAYLQYKHIQGHNVNNSKEYTIRDVFYRLDDEMGMFTDFKNNLIEQSE